MVPHVTDAIQEWIQDVALTPVDNSGLPPQVCLIELGGTVGDFESAVYLEALQQFQFKVGRENFMLAHLGLVPVMGATGEAKTKPCQHSVKFLREAGIKPDLLMCRSPAS
jgi:CTP synthase